MLDVPFVFLQRRRLPLHDRTSMATPRRSSATSRSTSSPRPRSCGAGTARGRASPRPSEPIVAQDYYSDGSRQGPALLPGQRDQPGRRGRGPRPGPHPARDGDWHRQDLHRLPDHLAAVEGRRQEAHPLPRRPQHPRGPDQDERLQAVRRRDDQDHEPQGRQVVRDLPRPLPGHLGHRPKDATSSASSRPDFFDLVIVDECHRGSAADNSAWREVLDYFSSATQLGLTATPKETRTSRRRTTSASRSTPTRSSRASRTASSPPTRSSASTSTRTSGLAPEKGKVDKLGQRSRTASTTSATSTGRSSRRSAPSWSPRRSPSFSPPDDRYDKTIVFCEDIDHAERMRSGARERERRPLRPEPQVRDAHHGGQPRGQGRARQLHPPRGALPRGRHDLEAHDDRRGRADLQGHRPRPDDPLHDRVQADHRARHAHREDFGKLYFTILDFRKATELFADPGFDGDPEQVYQPKGDDPIVPPDDVVEGGDLDSEPDCGSDGGGDDGEGRGEAGPTGPRPGASARSTSCTTSRSSSWPSASSTTARTASSSPSRSATTRRRRSARSSRASTSFLKTWTEADRKQAIIKELEEQGVFFDELAKEVGKDLSAFDLVCHVAFDQPPLTRKERANNVRKRNYFTKYGEAARACSKRCSTSSRTRASTTSRTSGVLKVQPLTGLGTPIEIVERFGGKEPYMKAVRELEDELYEADRGTQERMALGTTIKSSRTSCARTRASTATRSASASSSG
jgi:hypothetical protein